MARVSVLMPTYEQAAFLPRAVESLRAQTFADWELVVVDDGSPDGTSAAVAPFLAEDRRISFHRLPENRGLGAALNRGLDRTEAPLVAYLPSDDVLHADHLATLLSLMTDGVALAATACSPPDRLLQLVQVMHRRTDDRWLERPELESDDLGRLLLDRLAARGRVARSDRVTCEWTQHPRQRHRAIRASLDGGLNAFRSRYRVRRPLRFHASDGGLTDEPARYRRFRERPAPPRGGDGLRILLVGELAFNPERIVVLEERGHELLGLWIDEPLGFNSVGPLPVGHVRDLPREGWRSAVRELRPDVIYALLSWRAVPLAHEVLRARTGVPLVWHFKESPQRSIARGEWPLLAEVVSGADACVLSSPEERDWLEAALPGRLDPRRTMVLDGDLPKRDWLDAEPSEPLSALDGELHTVRAGRPYGFDDVLLAGLARRGIRVHVHDGPSAVGSEDWVRVLSRYDAGWLHPVPSTNGGDVRRATWDDLNLPARIPMLLAAGVPLILPRSPGAVHAAQALAASLGVGVLYDDLDDLAGQLRDREAMAARRARALAVRERFTFDHHADRLLRLLREAAGR